MEETFTRLAEQAVDARRPSPYGFPASCGQSCAIAPVIYLCSLQHLPPRIFIFLQQSIHIPKAFKILYSIQAALGSNMRFLHKLLPPFVGWHQIKDGTK